MATTTSRLNAMFGEMPALGKMAKMTKADEKKLMMLNKKYKCVDGVIMNSTAKPSKLKGEKTKSPWIAFVKEFYAAKKKANPKYSYKQALSDASKEYKKK